MSEKPDAPMSEEERADRLERMVDTLAGTVVDLKAENAALVAECDMALAVTVERDGLSGRLTNALARIQALEPLITENAALREAAANLVAGAIFNQTGVVITNAALYALRAALRPRTHGAMASECQEWREMLEKAARRDMMDAKDKHSCAEPRYFMDTAVVETDDGPPQPRQAAFLMCTQEGCAFHLGDYGEIVAYIRGLETAKSSLESRVAELETLLRDADNWVNWPRGIAKRVRAALRSADKGGT